MAELTARLARLQEDATRAEQAQQASTSASAAAGPIPHHPPLSDTGVELGLLSTASMHTKTNKLFLLVFSKL